MRVWVKFGGYVVGHFEEKVGGCMCWALIMVKLENGRWTMVAGECSMLVATSDVAVYQIASGN